MFTDLNYDVKFKINSIESFTRGEFERKLFSQIGLQN